MRLSKGQNSNYSMRMVVEPLAAPLIHPEPVTIDRL